MEERIEVRMATEKIMESEKLTTYSTLGNHKRARIIPIDEVCSKCEFWKGKFKSIKKCQESQKKDAEIRGFHKVICPHQLEEF